MNGDHGIVIQLRRCISEAVAAYRELSEQNSNGFIRHLAGALSVLGDHLDERNKKLEAFEAAEESLTLLAPFHRIFPAAYDWFAQATVDDYLRRASVSDGGRINVL